MFENPKTDPDSILEMMLEEHASTTAELSPHPTARAVMRAIAGTLSQLHSAPVEELKSPQDRRQLSAEAPALEREQRRADALGAQVVSAGRAIERLTLRLEQLTTKLDEAREQSQNGKDRNLGRIRELERAVERERRNSVSLSKELEQERESSKALKTKLAEAGEHGKTINRALQENSKLVESLSEHQRAKQEAEEEAGKLRRQVKDAQIAAQWREHWAEGFCGELDATIEHDLAEQSEVTVRHRERLAAAAPEKLGYWHGAQAAIAWVEKYDIGKFNPRRSVDEEQTAASVAQFLEGHAPSMQCVRNECEVCGWRDCPDSEALHYHHDGCPSCSRNENVEHQALVHLGARLTLHHLTQHMESSETRFRWGARGDLKSLLDELFATASLYWRSVSIQRADDTGVTLATIDDLEEMPF